jgi:hypothetical protein
MAKNEARVSFSRSFALRVGMVVVKTDIPPTLGDVNSVYLAGGQLIFAPPSAQSSNMKGETFQRYFILRHHGW